MGMTAYMHVRQKPVKAECVPNAAMFCLSYVETVPAYWNEAQACA